MKILFIAPRFHTNQLALVGKLLDEGHVVEYFVVGSGVSESYSLLRPKQIPASILNKWFLRAKNKTMEFSKYAELLIPSSWKYYKMIKEYSPDVIVLRGASVPRYSYVPMFYGITNNKKVVFYTQGPKYVVRISLARRVHDIFFIELLNFSWFTPVLFRMNDYGNLIKLNSVSFIPFFIYPKEYRRRKIAEDGKIKFLCVAKYEERKNIKLLLECFVQLSKIHHNFLLTVVGSTGTDERDSYLEEITAFVRDSDLVSAVELFANIPYSSMSKFYESHDVMILPSIMESASYSQLEAMAEGMAVICSNDNGSAHYIQHGENGFVVHATIDNLTNAIECYLKDSDLVALHGKRSCEIICKEYNMHESYLSLIKLMSQR